MDSRIELLVKITENEFAGNPFNGPSLLKTLQSLSIEQIRSTETLEGTSVWAVTLHLIYWKDSLCQKLGGKSAFDPFPHEQKDWPSITGDKTADSWSTTTTDLGKAHKAYINALETLPERRLKEEIADWKCTLLEAVSWMSTHDLYHAAQIRNMGVKG
jgi:uncharacterized damage-inducible protein DinB